MLASTTRPADAAFALDRGVVQVWHADIAASTSDPREQLGMLDERERWRASNLKKEQDRAQFIAAHSAARRLIGNYLGRPAETVRFGYEANGKPFVIRSGREPDLRFNASRTSGYAAFAFALGRRIGIDIERIADDPNLTDLYKRALTPNELAFVSALPSEGERQTAFFALWVRKEAFLKGIGEGLAISPSQIDVTRTIMRGGAKREWRVEEIACDSGCAAAVAAEGTDWRLGPVRSCGEWMTV